MTQQKPDRPFKEAHYEAGLTWGGLCSVYGVCEVCVVYGVCDVCGVCACCVCCVCCVWECVCVRVCVLYVVLFVGGWFELGSWRLFWIEV